MAGTICKHALNAATHRCGGGHGAWLGMGPGTVETRPSSSWEEPTGSKVNHKLCFIQYNISGLSVT